MHLPRQSCRSSKDDARVSAATYPDPGQRDKREKRLCQGEQRTGPCCRAAIATRRRHATGIEKDAFNWKFVGMWT